MRKINNLHKLWLPGQGHTGETQMRHIEYTLVRQVHTVETDANNRLSTLYFIYYADCSGDQLRLPPVPVKSTDMLSHAFSQSHEVILLGVSMKAG